MAGETNVETPEEAKLAARRKFLKTAAGVAVTAPAVTMLLAAPTKSHAGIRVPCYAVTTSSAGIGCEEV